VLGETLDPKAPEVDRAYALLVDARQKGLDAIATGDADIVLPVDCQALDDPERQIVDDEQFAVRAWMTVVAYLLADYRFMYG
jgi:hypothetical protein